MKNTFRARKRFIFVLALLCAVLSACASSQAAAPQTNELDAAIRETSDYLNKQLPKGNKLMILNVQSDYPALSEYIIDELIANTVNDRVFSVVDRQQLNTIRAELNFQMSGEVDDATAQSLGRMAGAQIIISGAISRIGDLYRLRVRALSVQKAQIEGQFNRNIPNGPTVTALVNSKATGYGESAAVTPTGAASGKAGSLSAPVTTPVATPVPAPTPAPAPAAPTTKKYEVVNRSLDWIKAKIEAEDRGGHLAVITSAQEQTTIENMVARHGEKRSFWLGGFRDSSNKYVWITNELMNYTNWAPGEPNDGRQDKVSMYGRGQFFGKWDNETNDLTGSGDTAGGNGYIIEWD